MADLEKLLSEATPGPWTAAATGWADDFNEVFGSDDTSVCPANAANARLIALAPDLAAEVIRLRARVAELEEVLRKVPGAFNAAFIAGTEEREGGSARRQEKNMAIVEAVRREIRIGLAALQEKNDE